jgi:4-hydroxymandelate oxidase
MIVSTTTWEFLEDVAAASDGPTWWQLYVFTDRGRTEDTLRRVRDSGFAAVCLTVDFPVAGLRHRDTRSGFVMPMGLPDADFMFAPDLTWDDLGWIREHAGLPLLVKGILTAEDARLAVEHGVDGIVVSNHGGRQLDGAVPSLRALPEVVEAVDGRVPVLFDGGVRRGIDVLRALALGATAVGVARPICWGLAVDGEPGVRAVLDILRTEFENAMTLSGARTVAEIDRTYVAPL